MSDLLTNLINRPSTLSFPNSSHSCRLGLGLYGYRRHRAELGRVKWNQLYAASVTAIKAEPFYALGPLVFEHNSIVK
jgi:hypothetical protein